MILKLFFFNKIFKFFVCYVFADLFTIWISNLNIYSSRKHFYSNFIKYFIN